MRDKEIIDRVEDAKEEDLRKKQTALFVEEQIEQEKKKSATAVAGILERHDEVLQSPLSKIAKWVGELAWYKHLILLTVVVAAAATVGFFLNAIAICAIAAGTLYLAIAGLLKLHHSYEQKHLQETSKLALYAEERLNEGIEDAKEMGAELIDLASGLQGASSTMESYSQTFAAQAQIQQEQTQATQQMNQQLHQMQEALVESHATIDQTSERISETWEGLHSKLAENVANLEKAEKSITQSASTITQSATSSTIVHEKLAQNVDIFVSRLDSVKENASLGVSLLEQVQQSTMDVLEARNEMDKSIGKLKATIEKSAQTIQYADKLIDSFPENRRLAEEDREIAEENRRQLNEIRRLAEENRKMAEEDRRLAEENRRLAQEDRIRYEQTMRELEQSEREFQAEYARVMSQIERRNRQTANVCPEI